MAKTSGNVLVPKQEFNWRQLATGYDDIDWAGGRAEAYRAEIESLKLIVAEFERRQLG